MLTPDEIATLPVFQFGSTEHTDLLTAARSGRRDGTFGWERHGFGYVVDHGAFRTVSMIIEGQRVTRDLGVA